jgi:iron complex outermembrane receptor protein
MTLTTVEYSLWKPIAIGAMLVIHSSASVAQTVAAAGDSDAPRSRTLENVYVEGQRDRQKSEVAVDLQQFGNQVQIVTAEQISEGGYTNFAEAVAQLVRGANIGYSPDEGEYTIRLDGGGDRDTLVTLDGVPLFDRGPALEDIWGSTTIDPHMIERIEVFRGGQSLFFGSNGGVGVVNIVTKQPDGKTKGEFGANYGDFNTRELWGNYSFPLDAEGRHSLMIYGGYTATDGPRIFAPEVIVDNIARAGGVQEYPLNRNNVGVKYLWKIDDTSELRLNAQYTQLEFEDPFPNTTVSATNRTTYPIADALYRKTWSDAFATEVQLYYSNPQLYNTELYPQVCRISAGCVDPGAPTRTIPYGQYTGAVVNYSNQGFGEGNQFTGGFMEYGATVRATIDFSEWLETVIGVQSVTYQDDSDPVFPVGDEKTTVNGVYLDLRPRLPFSPDTAISLAGRIDFADAFDSKTIWKFGLRQPTGGGTYVRANGGTSYSLPRSNELFANSETFVGNPDLQTEQTETFNVGAGFDRDIGGRRLQMEVGAFHTDISNRIESTTGLLPNTRFNNTAVTEIRGVTTDVEVEISDNWQLSLSYTQQDAKPENLDRQINETPEWFAQGSLTFHSDSNRYHFALLPRYQGPEFVQGTYERVNFGEYLVVNATFGFWAGDQQQHRLQLRGVNLLDEQYAERYGFGTKQFSEDFLTGQVRLNSPEYFFPYAFEGKPRSFFASYQYRF